MNEFLGIPSNNVISTKHPLQTLTDECFVVVVMIEEDTISGQLRLSEPN